MFFALLGQLFAAEYHPQDGDIIFQTSLSSQSKAIQLATQSPYSHVGVIYIKEEKPYVYEASSTVKLTPLSLWISRGAEENYMVMRARKPLSAQQQKAMRHAAHTFQGTKYDLKFEWSDERMYCSELVWKIYEAGGIKLIAPQKMNSYHFNHPEVQKLLQARWGSDINWKEPMVAPSDLSTSKKLAVVFNAYD